MSDAAIYKPKFVTHGTEQSAIFSLHVSPDGSRLATAGQGVGTTVSPTSRQSRSRRPLAAR